MLRLITALIVSTLLTQAAFADRIKDMVSVAGVRNNQLVGYGLVVGLNGTGDGSDISFTGQSLKSILSSLGVTTNPFDSFDVETSAGRPLEVDNVAAVMVTAELPPFIKPGQRIDVNVSTVGASTSLRGGSLIMTRMRGIDGETYAVAQGALTVTGISAEAAGTSVQTGVPTAGRIPDGAIVERMVETPFDKTEHIVLNIHERDFSTTNAITEKINETFGAGTAMALDGVSVAVRAPIDTSQRVNFLSMIENLDVEPGAPAARVVVNSRTGTVVINRAVRVDAAAVTHGTISVRVTATNEASQPNPFAGGETEQVQNAEISVQDEAKQMVLFQPGIDLRDLVDAVNQVGASPSSLIAILEALKRSGSLKAELVVI